MKQSGPLRMEDIAKLAGVSKSTVSKAFRNYPEIQAGTRRRVMEIARRAGYRRNPLVAALMAQVRSSRAPRYQPLIAFVSMHWNRARTGQSSCGLFWRGAQEQAEAMGYRLETFWPLCEHLSMARLAEILHARAFAGVILGPKDAQRPVSDEECAPLFTRFPVATLGFSFAGVAVHRASNHQFFNTLTALETLTGLGYRRPSVADHQVVDIRIGYQFSGAVAAHRAKCRDAGKIEPLLDGDMDFASFSAWVRREKPDAVLTTEPLVRDWLGRMGKRVPGDVAFAMLDTHGRSGVAGMDQHSGIVGAAAVDLVIGQIHRNEAGLPPFPKFVQIPGSWVDGPTAPARVPSLKRVSQAGAVRKGRQRV